MDCPSEMPRINRASIPGRLAAFYVSCPDEYLSYLDIAAKYTCSLKSAEAAVAKLRKHGLAKTIRNPNGAGVVVVAFAFPAGA